MLEGTHLRMNLDVGRQSNSGEAAVVLGNVANSRSCEEARAWELKSFPVRSLRTRVTASPSGRVWLLFGVDSGFEGRTEIYFTRAAVTFSPAGGEINGLFGDQCRASSPQTTDFVANRLTKPHLYWWDDCGDNSHLCEKN